MLYRLYVVWNVQGLEYSMKHRLLVIPNTLVVFFFITMQYFLLQGSDFKFWDQLGCRVRVIILLGAILYSHACLWFRSTFDNASKSPLLYNCPLSFRSLQSLIQSLGLIFLFCFDHIFLFFGYFLFSGVLVSNCRSSIGVFG